VALEGLFGVIGGGAEWTFAGPYSLTRKGICPWRFEVLFGVIGGGGRMDARQAPYSLTRKGICPWRLRCCSG
jgi:hypothetical protein